MLIFLYMKGKVHMNKIILYHILGVLAILAVILLRIPLVWIVLGVLAIIIAILLYPLIVSIENIPKGFAEKRFDTGKVTLNYIEGPDNGPPLLFIPGQTEFWQGYKLVVPHFSTHHHVYVIDLRGHGKSTRTPGNYSYTSCGKDLQEFLKGVIGKPSVVSGLSSGAILAVWLAANSPEYVSSIISEDPPLFSSMWPRIKEEKYMYHLFETMVDYLGKPERDLLGYFLHQGIPKEGKKELFLIPRWIARFIVGGFELNKKLHPSRPYDVPLFPFSGKVGLKFLSEYDVDFSRATIDGRLTAGFDPESTLKKITCPVLLIHARWSRHETWGLLGALDDNDVMRIRSIVKDLTYVQEDSIHDVHLSNPKKFIKIVDTYLHSLEDPGARSGEYSDIG
jgi:pimeloyl-ACP methyl ester carboxylesterase